MKYLELIAKGDLNAYLLYLNLCCSKEGTCVVLTNLVLWLTCSKKALHYLALQPLDFDEGYTHRAPKIRYLRFHRQFLSTM